MNRELRVSFGYLVFAFCIVFLAFLSLTPHVFASVSDQPALLVTWQAQNSIPSWYDGKAMPTYQSPIVLSLVVTQGGKIVSLASQPIKWFVNDDVIGYQAGLSSVTFVNKRIFDGGEIDVRVSVQLTDPDTGAQTMQTGYLSIPVVSPMVVVQAPPFSGVLSAGQSLKLVASPFFFLVPQGGLSFSWNINSIAIQNGTDPAQLSMQINPHATPSSQSVNVSVSSYGQSLLSAQGASGAFSFTIK